MNERKLKINPIVSGILVIIAGVLLFLFNSGVLPIEYKSIVFSVQMLGIAIGFVFLFNRQWGIGLLLILIGCFRLLQKLNIESLNFITQNGWTLLLIVIGIAIICRAIFGHDFFYCSGKKKNEGGTRLNNQGKRQGEAGYVDLNYVFSGTKEKVNAEIFKGGDVNCVFGGIELDLSDCELAEGVTVLKINSVFGGTVIYVPENWNIEIHQNQLFGSFVDNRQGRNQELDKNKTLIIEASSVFGGGEVRYK